MPISASVRVRMYCVCITLCVIYAAALHAQTASVPPDDYAALFTAGEYQKAYDAVRKRIETAYETRVDNKRVPTGFITVKSAEQGVNLNLLFRQRKAIPYFIENNPELFKMHVAAARCAVKLNHYEEALNHYYQSLRFKPLEYGTDDAVFYEIGDAYKKLHYREAYYDALESAYTLNPSHFEYSLELGRALYKTTQKKKAIYHLSRYVESKGDGVDDPGLYLMLANLNEDIGRYLETARYYKLYLAKKPDDGYLHFALGCIAKERIGDYTLAVSEFDTALKLLPPAEIYRRSKSQEYKADILFQELKFSEALAAYKETVVYQDTIRAEYDKKQAEIAKVSGDIRAMKSSLIKQQEYSLYTRYETRVDERGKLELAARSIDFEYRSLNAGKVRWNMAECFERLEEYTDAIKYYRESISYNYRANDAREKIIKLQLKIQRGY